MRPLPVSISIHSPRMGRDGKQGDGGFRLKADFNPLSPHGERHDLGDVRPVGAVQFQSTLPAWGETVFGGDMPQLIVGRISIHSPRMGRDSAAVACRLLDKISIHSPRMGRDLVDGAVVPIPGISIHSPRMGRDGKTSGHMR